MQKQGPGTGLGSLLPLNTSSSVNKYINGSYSFSSYFLDLSQEFRPADNVSLGNLPPSFWGKFFLKPCLLS